MTENQQSRLKQILLLALVVLLVFIAGVQTWYMVKMKKQLDTIQPQQTTAGAGNLAARPAPGNQPPVIQDRQKNSQAPSVFDDDFFNTPMNGQNWNPYEEIQRMQRNMDRMFNNAFNQFNSSPDFQHLFKQGVTTPQMDVKEDSEKYTIIVNLPGADESNVSVTLEGQVLTVKGEQDYENQDKNAMGDVIFRERRSGVFQRIITLPGPVEQVGMKTRIDNGVLTITVPRKKQAG